MIAFAEESRAALAGAVGRALKEPVVYVAATVPWWSRWLESVSEVAAKVAPILAILLALARIWVVLRESTAETKALDRVGKAGSIAGATVSTAAKLGGKWLGPVLGTLGIVALAAWMLSPSAAKAAPAEPARTNTRRRSDDHAGDDGETDAPPIVPAGPLYYQLAYQFIGTHEERNGRSNPKVQQFYPAGGLSAKSDSRKVPWCAVFVNWCLEQSGIAGTKSAMARSFLRWGSAVDDPQPGDIVVFWRGRYDDGETGHVGFVHRVEGAYVHCLGGNQGDAVKVAKFHVSRVLGYRRVRKASESRIVKAGAVTAGGVVKAVGAIGVGAAAEAAPQADAGTILEQVREPLMTLGMYWRPAAIAGCLIALAGVGFMIWRRYQDHKERGV